MGEAAERNLDAVLPDLHRGASPHEPLEELACAEFLLPPVFDSGEDGSIGIIHGP